MSTALEPVTVLRHVQAYTMDPAQPRAEALAWRGHRLIAAGPADEVVAAAGPRARLLDGGGATVIPGLIDAHIHFMWYAMGLLRVNLEGTSGVAAVRERLAARVATLEPGAWVLGGGWDNTTWDPPVFPTAADLDPVTGDHPAVLDRKDGHSIWVNHAALAAAGITRDTPDPPGGRIGRDAAGAPDGMLYEGAAIDLVADRVPPESAAARDAAIDEGLQTVVASGLTTIQDVELPEAFVGFQQRAAAGRLPVRVVMFLALPTLRESIAVGLRTGFGNARLRIGPVKIFSDGSLGSRTAEMLAPFEGTDDRGVATIPQADLEAAILAASAAGIAVAVHAIGDAANRRVLDAFARARAVESGAPRRPTATATRATPCATASSTPNWLTRPTGRASGNSASSPRCSPSTPRRTWPWPTGSGARGRRAAPMPGRACRRRAPAWPSAPTPRSRRSTRSRASTPR